MLNQTYKNIEIIAINDASTDNSLKKLQLIEDTRLYIYNNIENYGTYKTINIGLLLSNGNYITIQGSDDYATIDKISIMKNSFKISKLLLCYSNWSRGLILQKSIVGCYMFKRDLLKILGFFDNTRIGGDSEFINRYLFYNNKIIYINNLLNIASIRNKSLTNNKLTKINSDIRKNYIYNYKKWHVLIKKTKNYYMPFLHTKKNYEYKLYKFKKNKQENKIIKNILLDDIGKIIN